MELPSALFPSSGTGILFHNRRKRLPLETSTYAEGRGAGAGLYSSIPMVAGKTLISSSTLQGPSFWMVFTGSGWFSKVTSPAVTWKTCPLTWADSSDASQVTKGATSSASPNSPEPAVMPRDERRSRDSCGTLPVMRVWALGAMELAVTP